MRPRPGTVLGFGLVGAALIALGGLAATNAVAYYLTPTELAAAATGSVVRLYGIVVPGTIRYDEAQATVAFGLTDGTTAVEVRTTSIPTSLFSDGIGVVLIGRQIDPGRFEAQEILVKHSEVYAPLRPGETFPPGILEQLRGDSE